MSKLSRLSALLALVCALQPGLRALELKKEIERMPADKRPTPEQVAAAEKA